MRKVVVSEFVTLDGVMEAPDQWSMSFWNDEAARFKFEELLASDVLLLGRATYEGFAAAWPGRSDEAVAADLTAGGGDAAATDFDGFADRMNSLPKYVVSTTLETAAWQNSTIIRERVAETIAGLKEQPGGDILVAGSAALIRTLMRHDLVDAYRLLDFPAVVGRGARLFSDGATADLTLIECKAFDTGVVALTYRRAARA